jgi:hypothetical protein
MYIRYMENINDLQCGKAGEYLVCSDLILHGHVAFLSEQGLPFDVVFEYNHKLLKVQVKTTRKAKSIPQRKSDVPAYIFHIGINGKMKDGKRRSRYDKKQVDIFALVALDTKRISYLPHFDTQTTMNFRVPELKGKYHDEQGAQLKHIVLELKKTKISCEEIAQKTGLSLANVYRYSANVSIEQKGTNAGVYFDDFTLEKCLKKIC